MWKKEAILLFPTDMLYVPKSSPPEQFIGETFNLVLADRKGEKTSYAKGKKGKKIVQIPCLLPSSLYRRRWQLLPPLSLPFAALIR